VERGFRCSDYDSGDRRLQAINERRRKSGIHYGWDGVAANDRIWQLHSFCKYLTPCRFYPKNPYEDLRIRRFDCKEYRLNETVSAFSLGMVETSMYPGGWGEDEFLDLFKVENGSISLVLSTLVRSTSTWPKYSETKVSHRAAVIRIQTRKSNGMFDLRKSTSELTRNAAIFHWTGTKYETTDADPVEDVNSTP